MNLATHSISSTRTKKNWHLQGAYLTYLLFIFACLFYSSIEGYEVRFEGISDPEILTLVKTESHLEKLKETPPATIVGLRRRAEKDITNIIQVFHSQAFYNARVRFVVENEGELVIVTIDPGQVYPLASFQIQYFQYDTPLEGVPICLEELGVQLGAAALPETILDAEDTLLDILNLQGYAFASIKKREVLVDQETHDVKVILHVEMGPLTYFGPVTITGNERVLKSFFYKKLRWCEGDIYDPKLVEKTQEALELSGLFRSVNITHAEEPMKGNLLPMEIDVLEAKQRSIGLGVNYTTDLGPGITAEWEDRNYQGEGQKLSFRTDIWKDLQEGTVTYLIPDFYRPDQNLIWRMSYDHEKTEGFIESTFALSATIERKLSENLRFSYGGVYKLMRSTDSARNGVYDLIQAPFQVRWSNADSILEPTKGMTFNLKTMPSLQILSPYFAFLVNTFNGSGYYALTADKKHVFAAKLMFGSIIGASKHDIPPPERFYAGSESVLRGYKYLTVSPLNHDHKPIGGRSLLVYSLELRNRINEDFGWVLFYDIGNVYLNPYPDKFSMLQSAGIGIRYYTPVGPLRLDFAVPLNRRDHIDKPFQIYFSIGQSF